MLADQSRKAGLLSQSSTGTNPADDTRFCSSNTADPAVNVYDERTENASRTPDKRDLNNLIVPVQGIFAVYTPIKPPAHPRIQA